MMEPNIEIATDVSIVVHIALPGIMVSIANIITGEDDERGEGLVSRVGMT